jgi:hypothetical protein
MRAGVERRSVIAAFAPESLLNETSWKLQHLNVLTFERSSHLPQFNFACRYPRGVIHM